MTDTLFVYECDRCGDQLLVGRAGLSEPDPSWDASLCWRTTESGERCTGRVHLVDWRPIGTPRFE